MKKSNQIEVYQKYMTIAPIPENVLKSCKAELSGEEALLMGHRYFKGTDEKQNYGKAVEYYKMAAQKGVAEAYLALSFCSKLGKGSAIDLEQGEILFQKAAALWSRNLCREMGIEELMVDTKPAEIYKRSVNQNLKAAESSSGTAARKISTGVNQDVAKNHLDENFRKILFEGVGKVCNLYRIREIVFSDSINENIKKYRHKDISKERNGSVIGWIETVRDKYDSCILHIDGNGRIGAPGNCKGLFSELSHVKKMEFKGAFDTGNTYNMERMFSRCGNLEILDVSGFDTGNVTNMSYMFSLCRSLKALDVSGFDTEKVTDMRYMFYQCASLKALDMGGFDRGKAANTEGIFDGCENLKMK